MIGKDFEMTQSKLKEHLIYDPESGNFRWIKTVSNRTKVFSNAGCLSKKGYLVIRLYNKLYYAHRLAWLYVYGVMPESEIDHINRNPLDNSICNLRSVSHQENMQNIMQPYSTSTTGLRGAYFQKRENNYVSRIKVNGHYKTLGSFKTPELAHLAYIKAKTIYHISTI